MSMIKLTDENDGGEVYVRPDAILTMRQKLYPHDVMVTLVQVGSTYFIDVKETPEEIMALMVPLWRAPITLTPQTTAPAWVGAMFSNLPGSPKL